jgi:TrmH family RNA methyltransferase
MTVSLPKNRVKTIRSLAQKKERDETGLFIVEGVRLMREAAASDFEIVEVFYTAEAAGESVEPELLETLRRRCAIVERISAREMARIAGTVHASGILAIVRQRPAEAGRILESRGSGRCLVALDGVADPGNVGTIIRTCDWFGVDAVIAGQTSADLYNPKVVRATMGGMFHLPVATDVDLAAFVPAAREQGYTVYVTELTGGKPVGTVHPEGRSLVVFGNEAWGVSGKIGAMADVRVTIPRMGAAESLNVAVACGVVLSHFQSPSE